MESEQKGNPNILRGTNVQTAGHRKKTGVLGRERTNQRSGKGGRTACVTLCRYTAKIGSKC